MRKYQNFALLLCSLFFSLYSFAQQPLNQINILSFSVKNKLPADVSTWSTIPGGMILTVQRIPQSALQGIKLVVQIKQGGAKICGNPIDASPLLDFNAVKTFTGAELSGYISNCTTLKPGSYSICVQFYNLDRYPISKEICKEFVVEDAVQVQQNYSPPQNINPVNGKEFKPEELKAPVTFRWVPVVPKPRDPITYRLKVWQLMQGQTGSGAMRTNQPIVTKDVDNITQAVVTNIYTGPCRPPYLCDYVWNVQAVNKEGKPIGSNDGFSEPTTFSIAGSYAITIDSLQIDCPLDTKYNFKVKICNPNNATAIFDKLELVIVNAVVLGTPLNITSITPAIGTTIPANGCIWVTGSFNYATPFVQACLKGYIKDQALPGLNKAESFTCDSLFCACDPCKTLGVTLKDDKLSTIAGSGQVLLTGSLVGLNPSIVKKITMELVYFNIEQTGDSNCVKCAENKEWGNFIKPAAGSFTGYNPGVLNGINFGREWTWLTQIQKDCGGTDHNGGGIDNPTKKQTCATCGTGIPPAPADPSNSASKIVNPGGGVIVQPWPPSAAANSFALPIAVPPGSSLKCCGDKIKICIRYTVWDFCCHACDFIKCYEIERKAQ